MKLKNSTEINEDFILSNFTYLDNANKTYLLKRSANSYASFSSREDYENVRHLVKKFINANKENEIVFTSGVIHSLNLIANALCPKLGYRDTVIVPESEPTHNLDLWRRYSEIYNFDFKTINVIKDGTLDLGQLDEFLDECAGKIIFSISHACESIGTVQPIKELFLKIKEYDGITIADISNTVGKQLIDIQDIDADFVVFNSNNIYGPDGVGVLYGKHKRLEKLFPLFFDECEFRSLPHKLENFETNIQGVVAFGKAIEYLLENDIESISARHKMINANFQMMINELDFIKVFHPNYYKSGLISFAVKDMFPLDVQDKMLQYGIIADYGFLNSKKIIEEKFSSGIVRISWALYTDKSDIEKLELCLKSCYK